MSQLTWKKRWFVLDQDAKTLSYFKDPQDSKPIKDAINLAQVTGIRVKKKSFWIWIDCYYL